MATMLRLERQGPLAVLTLDRPPANALNRDFFVELCTTLPALRASDVHGVVVTGTGRFFSAGLDLFEILTYQGAEASAFMARFDDGFTGLFALEKPVVAAVNGHAIAGGAVLAATADFRLAAEGDGRIGLTEIQARAGGEDPIWAVWRAPETRAAIEAFAARAIGRRSRP